MIIKEAAGLPSTTRTLNILITGGRAPVALELARQLHGAGHQVYAADSISRYLCRASRAVKAAAVLPPPRQQPQAFVEALESLLVRWQIDLLIPTCEEIFHIARERERLQRHCQVLAPELDLLHQLHHKGEFIRLAEQLGLQVPDTEIIASVEAWRSAEALGMGSGLVFKPAYSRFASRVILPSSAGVSRKRQSADRALREAAWEQISSSSPWIVQEYIQGAAWCTYSVAYEGNVVAHANYECRYRTGGAGASVHFRQREHPEAYTWVQQFISGIGYSGQISFDFIQAKDGTLYPLECNPRATSGIHLFTETDGLAAALTDPERLLQTGRTVTPTPGAAAMITLAMLGCGLKDHRNGQDWRTWTTELRGAHDVIWRREDRGPAVEQLRMIYHAWRLSRRLGITVTEALTQDIEWNGET
ncbi:hypothetical protein D3C74_90370 [compost metagenome]